MKIINEYHHLKGGHLDRVAKAERWIIDELVNSPIVDEDRESSIAWELTHSSSCKAFMHVLAEKRNIPVDLARVAGVVHDYYVIKTGKYKNHAQLGAPLVKQYLANTNDYSDQEIDLIIDMVANHSDKHIHSDVPHVELIKDADVFDCSLYNGTEVYYLTLKELPVCHDYFERVLNVRKELNMPLIESYNCLRFDGTSGIKEITSILPELRSFGTTINALLLQGLSKGNSFDKTQSLIIHDSTQDLKVFVTNIDLYQITYSVINKNYIDLKQDFSNVCDLIQQSKKSDSVINILGIIEQCFVIASPDINQAFRIEQQLSSSIGDFHCDNDLFMKLKTHVLRTLNENIDLREILERCARLLPEPSQQLQELLDSIDNHLSNTASESSELKTVSCLEDYIKMEAQKLMIQVIGMIGHQLLDSSGAMDGMSLNATLPYKLFNCEPCGQINDQTPWTMVLWNGFETFEFTIGDEGKSRYDKLLNYFTRGSIISGSKVGLNPAL